MATARVAFDNWPFEKGERVKLIKISKPYSDKGLWYIDAVYLSAESKRAKRVKRYFGDLHLLICGADYIDGKRQDMPGWTTVDIPISKQLINISNLEPYLNEDKINQKEFNYHTFGFSNKGIYYIIPLHELLRAVLAPDIFWLIQMTLLDSIDTRVAYELDHQQLTMNFFSEVPARYANMDEKIKQAAWVFSNLNIYTMIDQTYHSIMSGNGIKFDFLFHDLHFTAKAEVRDNKAYVKEITAVKGKKINCDNIIVNHAGFVAYEDDSTEKEKKWTPVERGNGDKSLVSDKTAKSNKLDIDQCESAGSEYISFVKIKRIKTKRSGGTKVSSATIPRDVDGNNKRTTADTGGLDAVPQLEFENKIDEKLPGDFAEIIAILSLMEDRDEVVSIGYHIGELNDHYQFRSVCTLNDGITPRKYLAAQIKLADDKEAMLIEVEKRNLTTRIFISTISQDWNLICHKIMKRFIESSGSWSDIEDFEFKELDVCKFKHTNSDVGQREKRMFRSLNISTDHLLLDGRIRV